MREAIFMEQTEAPKQIYEVEETSIGEVAQILHSLGVKAGDMIAILQAIKKAGAIQAELEII